MKIAILHYHLLPGGVTRIIGSQIRGLQTVNNKQEVRVLCGKTPGKPELSGVPVWENPVFQYLKTDGMEINFQEEAERIIRYIKAQAEGCLLHCHNPNLGKNPALTLALYLLAEEGVEIVNHCHDFAEDRPGNMDALERMFRQTGIARKRIMYPDRPNYHFVVLNSFDRDRILKTKIPEERVHLLPNPVTLDNFDPLKEKHHLRGKIIKKLQLHKNRKICTYPVRAIKRKNLGELVLLAVLFEKTFQFVITQPPKNPEEVAGYLRWKDFCQKHNLGIIFEAGDIVNHEDLIGISDFCITTSAREGFGMVYLEPWLAGTPVSGRNLPVVTDDLRKVGLKFPGLYDMIRIPFVERHPDFKDLGPDEQEDCILRILQSYSDREELSRLNPMLESLFTGITPGLIEENRKIILNQFSVSQYGERLFALYKSFSR
jgi:glycosyltransferase involved in cell wall biosynthesis